MKRVAYMVALAMTVPLSAWAQAPADAGGPVDRVLAHRQELSLTADQIRKLETIDRKFDEKDADLIKKIESLRGEAIGVPAREMTSAERDRMFANRAELRPLMEQLRTSHASAIAEVRDVLTTEQNTRANDYLYQGAGPGRGRGSMQGRGYMQGRGSMPGRGRGMMHQRRCPGCPAGS